MVGAFGDGVAFDADVQPRGFHHGKHIRQTLARPADQITFGVVELHRTGRAGVYAELVFDADGAHAVASAQAAVCVHQIFRHDKHRHALHARRGIGQAREHQMDDVFRHFLIAPSDEDFLTAEGIRAVFLRHGTGGDMVQIRTRLRFAQIHRSRPFATAHFRQVGLFLLLAAMFEQRVHRPQRQHRHQRQGEVGGAPHLFTRRRHNRRQPLPAKLRRRAQTRPTRFAEIAVGTRQIGMGGNQVV